MTRALTRWQSVEALKLALDLLEDAHRYSLEEQDNGDYSVMMLKLCHIARKAVKVATTFERQTRLEHESTTGA